MLKKSLIIIGVAVLAACGPSPQPPAQAPATEPPPAAAPAPAPPPAAAPGPSAADEEAARVRAEERKLERLKREEARAREAQQQPPQAAYTPPPACQDCGVIAAITPVRQSGEAGMLGTLGGAAAGGLAGNQFGKGKGNTAMTVLGVVGGAFAGREVEKAATGKTVYQVSVNMETGGSRTVTVASAEGLVVGTHVHVDGNNLQPY